MTIIFENSVITVCRGGGGCLVRRIGLSCRIIGSDWKSIVGAGEKYLQIFPSNDGYGLWFWLIDVAMVESAKAA